MQTLPAVTLLLGSHRRHIEALIGLTFLRTILLGFIVFSIVGRNPECTGSIDDNYIDYTDIPDWRCNSVVVIQCTRWHSTFVIVLDDREDFILKTLQRIAKDQTKRP